MVYSAPYTWGSNGITYNVDKIKQRMPDAPIGSLAMLFDPKIVSRFADCGVTLMDAPTEVIPLALKYLGKDPKSAAPADLKAAQDCCWASARTSEVRLGELPHQPAQRRRVHGPDLVRRLRHRPGPRGGSEEGHQPGVLHPQEGSLIWFDNLYIPTTRPTPPTPTASSNTCCSRRPWPR
jgi:putrescine transport system substrate-binding protein